MQSDYLRKLQRENFGEAYRLHLENRDSNKNTKIRIIRLKFPIQFYNNHTQLIDDWIDNCNRNLKPREYGINYLQPTENPNIFDGLAFLPNKEHQENLLLTNDSEILGEDQIAIALYNENATLEIEITKTTAPTIANYYQYPHMSETEIKVLKIKHDSPKYYTQLVL
jgi:hypothetical protein